MLCNYADYSRLLGNKTNNAIPFVDGSLLGKVVEESYLLCRRKPCDSSFQHIEDLSSYRLVRTQSSAVSILSRLGCTTNNVRCDICSVGSVDTILCLLQT